MSPPTPAIKLQQLTRDFGDLRAVDGLSFEVPRGVVFGFLGPNGAGKTTTLRMLLGLLPPSDGKVSVLGFDPATDGDAVRRRVGALLDEPGLYDRLSGEENLDFYGRIHGLGRHEREARIAELLHHFGLWERRRDRVQTWSLGMRKKLALARALLHHPELVLFDEPTSGLDARAAASLRRDLLNLTQDEGVTVFLTTHNMAEAEQLCSEVAICRRGRLLAIGEPADLAREQCRPHIEIVGRGLSSAVVSRMRSRPEVSEARIEDDRLVIELCSDIDTGPLVAQMVADGVEIMEVRRPTATLEETFLALTSEE